MHRDRADLVAQQNALIEGKVAYQVASHVSDNEKAQMEWYKKLKLLLRRGLPPSPGHQASVGKYVRSGCTTALNVVPWETDGESVLREAMTNTQTPPPATTVVIPTGAPATNTVANHAERPEKFNGQNFKRWQQKMFFYLTTLGLARFLKETVPQVEPPAEGQSSNAQAVEAWKHSDFLCHNYVLNGLIDPLYNVYCKTTTTNELWESLERKYKTEDAGTKKFW
ncbi:hypothetical protein Tco_0553257 [Tanacetum coccineum]